MESSITPIIDNKIINESIYKVLIVDDEKTIHKITKMVLSKLTLGGKHLEFLSAHSAAEAKEVMDVHNDIAVILLDVVMEEEDSGLKLVKYIREDLKNVKVRIILRTGQPGYAPQKEVIMNYDINDYKEKNLLTSSQLYISVITALRSYRDLEELDIRQGQLTCALEVTTYVLSLNNVNKIAKVFLKQAQKFAHFTNAFALITTTMQAETSQYEDLMDKGGIFGVGHYETISEKEINEIYLHGIKACLQQCSNYKDSYSATNEMLITLSKERGHCGLIYIYFDEELTANDRNLMELYSQNVLTAIQSMLYNQEILNKQLEINNKNIEIIETQREMVMKLGEVVEYKSRETANHTNRVAEMAGIIGEEIGLSSEECGLLKFSAPMHDVGKIGIEDKLLNKPGKLSDEEYKIIKNHPMIGYDLFKSSKRELLHTCAIVALQHHERWDGNGYPNGLKGEDIHLFGRIVALVDVFDALTHNRIYKEAWSIEDAKQYIVDEKGKYFDPMLVEAFISSLPRLVQVMEAFPS
jgi:response regulator RpfG family c-di-GMP phosphodiesterase